MNIIRCSRCGSKWHTDCYDPYYNKTIHKGPFRDFASSKSRLSFHKPTAAALFWITYILLVIGTLVAWLK